MKTQKKDHKLTICYTDDEKRRLEQEASSLGMRPSLYAHDKLFNGKERNKYARRAMCKSLVAANYAIDKIYDEIAKTDSEYIEISKIVPHLDNAKKELNRVWNHY